MKDKLAYTSEIMHQIETIRKFFKAEFAKQCEEFGFTLPQLLLLHEVFHNPGITLNELSEKLLLAKSTVSDIVSRLEARDMMRRERPSGDKRITKLYLTENALSADSILCKIKEQCYTPIITYATEDEMKQILESLKLFNEIIERK